jgi:hypothetical protein
VLDHTYLENQVKAIPLSTFAALPGEGTAEEKREAMMKTVRESDSFRDLFASNLNSEPAIMTENMLYQKLGVMVPPQALIDRYEPQFGELVDKLKNKSVCLPFSFELFFNLSLFVLTICLFHSRTG